MSAQLSCRMYENQYPEVDDLVMVNVKQGIFLVWLSMSHRVHPLSTLWSIIACFWFSNTFPTSNILSIVAEMGAYVHLLEYNNIEGMILLSELSRRRIRSIQKLIRVGRNEVVVVLRVDKDKVRWAPPLGTISPLPRDISICQREESHPKITSSAKKSFWSRSKFILSCVTLPKRLAWISRPCTKRLPGRSSKNTDMPTMHSSLPLRMFDLFMQSTHDYLILAVPPLGLLHHTS